MTRARATRTPPYPPACRLTAAAGLGLFVSREQDTTADTAEARRQRIESALADYLRANRHPMAVCEDGQGGGM